MAAAAAAAVAGTAAEQVSTEQWAVGSGLFVFWYAVAPSVSEAQCLRG